MCVGWDWQSVANIFRVSSDQTSLVIYADTLTFSKRGRASDDAVLLRGGLQTYECQRNCCGFLAEPWLSTMLTSAGRGDSSPRRARRGCAWGPRQRSPCRQRLRWRGH